MIPLPNVKWVRSTKMPAFAICMDPDSPFFCCIMTENASRDDWAKVSALGAEDMVEFIEAVDPALEPFKPLVRARLDEMHRATAADQARGAAVLADHSGALQARTSHDL